MAEAAARHRMRRRFVPSGHLALGFVAAAITALATPSVAAATTIEPIAVRSNDGTILRGHVHRPDGPGPFATVLNLSPYWNGPAYLTSSAPDAPDTIGARFLLDAGYALALVNMRGTGVSSRCTTFGDPREWDDAAAVVEGVARQPWSNGRVGMFGISFDGWSQWMAVARKPPSLKAVVPMSGVIDLWSLLTRRGAPISDAPGVPVAWWGLTSATSVPPEASHFNCVAEQGANVDAGTELIETGDRTRYFEARDMRPHIRKTRVPTLLTNGMVHFGEGHVLQYEGLWELLRPKRTHFVLGQWEHDTPAPYKPGWEEQVLGWYGRYLRREPETVPTGVVEYQDAAGAWHESPGWPPPSTPATIHLGDATLGPEPPAVASPQAFPAVDLLDPVTTCGPHQALYVSPPLAEDVLVAGNMRFDFEVTSTESGGNLVALLRHTAGAAGCAGFGQAADVGRSELDLRHWRTPGRSRDFPVGTPTRVVADGHPMAVRVPAGHRLVLGISGGALDLTPEYRHPLLTIAGGSIALPVVEGQLLFAD